MAFLKRLGFFLLGLSIGLVFLTLFLKKKAEKTGMEFCYFPNCRALKDIRSKSISYSDGIKLLLQNQQLDSTDIHYFLNEGEVDFRKSDTKSSSCKIYVIEGLVNDKEAIMTVKNCTEKAFVENIVFQDEP